MKIKKIVKGIIFILIFLVGFLNIQTILSDVDLRDYKRITGFFDERENSLDAVFLGSSSTYAYWNPPVAFAEYGITVYTLGNATQPSFAAEFLIEDAIKKQPDALFIINVTNLLEEYDTFLHKLLVNYPNTINKFRMTNYLCDISEFSLSERMEYYFPIIRFHSRWSELTIDDFDRSPEEYKTGSTYKAFLAKTTDVSGVTYDLETTGTLSAKVEQGLNDLMDYCEEKGTKVLFVISPQALTSKSRFIKQNTTVSMLEKRGFDVLDLRKCVEEIDLDFTTDFYNVRHTNIHGSLKITDYISRYLIENYGFEDKRGMEEYSDWTKDSFAYYKKIFKYLYPEDLEYLKSIK